MKKTAFLRLSVFIILFLFLFLGHLSAEEKALDLKTVLDTFNARLDWEPLTRSATLHSGGQRISFRIGDYGGASLFNGNTVVRGTQPWLYAGELRFPESWLASFSALISRSQQEHAEKFRVAAILIDPGHGGKDPGAIGSHTIAGKKLEIKEKDIALKVAQDLHSRLKKNFPDKRVLLTRTGDTYPSLEERVQIANTVPLKENEAVIYLSIHCKASFNKSARGYEVWYLSPDYRRDLVSDRVETDNSEILPIINDMLEEEFTTESIIIAQNVLHYLDLYFGDETSSRGLKAAEWFVVRNAKMPSILVELGFVTNMEDAKLFTSPYHLQRFGEALYSAVADYVRSFEAPLLMGTVQ